MGSKIGSEGDAGIYTPVLGVNAHQLSSTSTTSKQIRIVTNW